MKSAAKSFIGPLGSGGGRVRARRPDVGRQVTACCLSRAGREGVEFIAAWEMLRLRDLVPADAGGQVGGGGGVGGGN